MRILTALTAISILSAACASTQRGSELHPITRLACEKDIVLLGELPSHGEAKTHAMKAAIVQELVQSCSFDAVLYEAAIYDFIGFKEAAQNQKATTRLLDNAIGRFWLTRDLAPYRSWLFEQATSKGTYIGGMDDQLSVTSEYGRSRLPQLVSADCRATVSRNLEWTYSASQRFDAAEKQRLRECVPPSNDPLLRNLHTYVERQATDGAVAPRDSVMANNVAWQLSQMPRGSKVVIWTATVHAARRQGHIPYKPLGAYLIQRYGDRVAAIGFTALRGQSSMAGQAAKALADLPATSLEARSLNDDVAWKTVGHKTLRAFGKVPSRLLGPIVEANWADYFDAVVVFREEVAPVFEEWRRPRN
jgi:erythromycin esterase-like protein